MYNDLCLTKQFFLCSHMFILEMKSDREGLLSCCIGRVWIRPIKYKIKEDIGNGSESSSFMFACLSEAQMLTDV